jgi:hypothetical protein
MSDQNIDLNKPYRSPLKKWYLFALIMVLVILSCLKFIQELPCCCKLIFPVFGQKGNYYDGFDLILYGLWVIVPPAFFMWEYAFKFDDAYKLSGKHLEDFKHSQELASKIWAAISVFFAILLFVKYGEMFAA